MSFLLALVDLDVDTAICCNMCSRIHAILTDIEMAIVRAIVWRRRYNFDVWKRLYIVVVGSCSR